VLPAILILKDAKSVSSEAGRLKAHLLKKRLTTTWSDTLASTDWWTLQKLQCCNNAFTPYFRSDSQSWKARLSL
jgi:hypothetical protein